MTTRLIDAFAAAAVDGSQWMPALELLADLTGSSRSELIGIAGSSVDFHVITAFDEGAAATFAAAAGYDPESNFRVAASIGAPLLAVLGESSYARAIAGLADDAYVDYCRDYQLSHGCQATIATSPDGLTGLTLLRSDRDGPTNAEQRRIVADIAPHVRSAVHIRRALQDDAARLMTDMLDAVACAAFLCDGTGMVCGSTPAAEALLSAGRLGMRAGRLSGGTRDETEALAAAIHRAATGPAVSPVATLVVRGADPQLPLMLDIVALPRRWAMEREPRAMVLARDRRRQPRAAAALLQTAFGLSPSEAAIALALGDGTDRETIAAARGVSIHTVRSQIKVIFLKLDLTRETELVAWINRLF